MRLLHFVSEKLRAQREEEDVEINSAEEEDPKVIVELNYSGEY